MTIINTKTKKIAIIGVFAGLSTVLYFLKFNLPIFPTFLKFQFSNLPLIIAGFALGPKSAILMLGIKTIIASIFSFANSYAIGEITDFIIGLAVILVTTNVYRSNKTKKRGALALFLGTITWVLIALPLNYFVIVPAYIEIYCKGDIQTFISWCSIIPGINENNFLKYYLLFGALPFNLILSSVVSLVTFIVYKRVSIFLKHFEPELETND